MFELYYIYDHMGYNVINMLTASIHTITFRITKIKFSDIKSPDPEIDHILPLSEEGTNNLENLQILCGCCHNKKSTLEGLMKSNNGKVCPRIISEYSILSKQKYKEELEKVFEESSDSDSDIIIRARRKRLFG